MPALHAKHIASLEANVVVEYLPGLQFVHDPAPLEDHVPAGHIVHVVYSFAPTAEDAVPGLQGTQSAILFPPVLG